MKFFAPRDAAHVSHSIVNLQETSNFFEAECIRFSDFLELAGLSQVDILKLDVEGAEYSIIEDVLSGNVLPSVMLVEYDEANHPKDPNFRSRIRNSIELCRSRGYILAHVEACNFMFVRTNNK